jgi:hypothetical protein
MKFGQLFGLGSIEAFERDRVATTRNLEQLRALAPAIAAFAVEHLDRHRFLWLTKSLSDETRLVAEGYAKAWTCSLIADQNAQTEYRNWRKAQQELAIEAKLVECGYVRSTFAGDLERRTDINLGEYSKERRVRGGTVQKADLAVRRRGDGRLVLIEAKAVGVQVDAFKRVKECCDKARDWRSNRQLGAPLVVAVLGGFFVERNLEALAKAQVAVAWEHDLDSLRAALEAT